MTPRGTEIPLFGGTPLWGQTHVSPANSVSTSTIGGYLGGGDFARVHKQDTGVYLVSNPRNYEVVTPTGSWCEPAEDGHSSISLAHNMQMISATLALRLRTAGVRWRPSSGDSFIITREGFEGDVFVVSDMTIESHEFETGTILGFNGTTEWALDSVAIEDALWLPREDQLRGLLGGSFDSLARSGAGYTVGLVVNGQRWQWDAANPADAYAVALLRLVSSTV